ncbi:MAG TPA: hypothetical protein PLJ38_03185, partial [bacterium]|nr:hypothetical protein [bacterium]
MKRTAIFFFSCLIIILAIYKIKINAAGGYYAPQGFTAPTIISAQNDYNGEIDIKWLNMSSSNDTQTGVYQSWLIYYVYRKADADFTALDTQVIMSEGILVDTVSQIVNDGHPQTFTYWSDTSVK